ncbi:plant UBX domain-containing protein 8-like isoform X2 [Phalaenopsis equestris]|uniref:plant UBX domain-containing protein 8-like isoform X2 n=1 Tax=Phalaenopsis equestris TaxID=78828 RepID=UPI0009E1D39B|nr:plant UBX domain-containing protein 8-like isoform X2 [Phalaenopsis equestris]
MGRPAQEAIDMFMSITGASEAVAVQKLEEYGGDLNEAVNSHFSQGDRMNSSTADVPVTRNDFMDIDDPFNITTAAPALPPFSAIRRLNPFSILESHFGQSLFDGGTNELTTQAPRVSHPRDVREIPIEFKDENSHSGSSGHGPKIEDITGSVSANETVVHGTVIIDDGEDEVLPADHGANHSAGVSARRHPTTNFTPLADVTDYSNDIEEEMIKAAIEASKREALEYGRRQYDVSDDSFVLEESDLAHAVTLSLKTAEKESELRAKGLDIGEQSFNASGSKPENSGSLRLNGSWSQGPERSRPQTSNQSNMNEGDPSFEDEVDDADEEPLIVHRSRPAASGNAPEQILSTLSSPRRHEIARHARHNGDTFKSDEWGGISSEEHDEAVMLEAAIFGGVPVGTSYHFEYPHQVMPSNYDRAPHPPSPRLAEQRMLREQQDDEYLASLQADREKELKAMQETDKRRLEEAAALEAAVKREKHQEEEAYRKQLEEEEFERKLAAKQASLPQEPSVDNENSVTLLIRMPDGSRCGRRFLKSDKLQVRPYPRRSFTNKESQLSLSELGLTSKQEALFLELI